MGDGRGTSPSRQSSSSVKAWRFHPGGGLRLDEVELGAPQPGWSEIKVETFQVSVTEALALAGRPGIEHDLVHRALAGSEPRQLFGHEFCGVVSAVGDGDAAGAQVGQRVVALGKVPCLTCEECRAGHEPRCLRSQIVGLHFPGCFAERVHVPTHALVPVDRRLPPKKAAALQPLSSCVACFHPAAADAQDRVVLVLGLGPMGLFLLQLAKLAGARRVIGVARRDAVLEAAREDGITIVDARDTDAERQILDAATDGADVIFEATGAARGKEPYDAPMLDVAVRIARPGATVYGVSTFPGPIRFDPAEWRAKSLRYSFLEFASRRDLVEAHCLVLNGSIRVDVSHIFDGIERLPEAIEATLNKASSGLVGTAQVRVSG